MTDDVVSGVPHVDRSEIGKSRHLPPPRGACVPAIQCYYVPVISNTEYLERGVPWASR